MSKVDDHTSFFDLHKLNSLIESKDDVFFIHLATMFDKNDSTSLSKKFIESNLLLGVDILNFMMEGSFRNLIFTESYWQFDKRGSLDGNSLYATSKSFFSLITKYYSKTTDLKISSLVLYDTFGSNDQRLKILSQLFQNLHEKKKLKMTEGDQILDFVHIEDVMHAFNVLIKIMSINAKAQKFNRYVVRGLRPLSLKSYVKLIEKTLNVSFNIEWGALKYSNKQIFNPWLPDNTFLLPGWYPKKTFEQRIKDYMKDE